MCKNCHFLVVKFSVYLNRRVFVMNTKYLGTEAHIRHRLLYKFSRKNCNLKEIPEISCFRAIILTMIIHSAF